MSNNPLEIKSGYNHFDPLSELFNDAARPSVQNPAVQDRCAVVFSEALALCCQYPAMDNLALSPSTSILTTPAVGFVSEQTANTGSVWLTATLFTTPGLVAVDYEHSRVALWAQPKNETVPSSVILTLGHSSIIYTSKAGERAGDHGELNYFRIITDKIRDAAFPKKPIK